MLFNFTIFELFTQSELVHLVVSLIICRLFHSTFDCLHNLQLFERKIASSLIDVTADGQENYLRCNLTTTYYLLMGFMGSWGLYKSLDKELD